MGWLSSRVVSGQAYICTYICTYLLSRYASPAPTVRPHLSARRPGVKLVYLLAHYRLPVRPTNLFTGETQYFSLFPNATTSSRTPVREPSRSFAVPASTNCLAREQIGLKEPDLQVISGSSQGALVAALHCFWQWTRALYSPPRSRPHGGLLLRIKTSSRRSNPPHRDGKQSRHLPPRRRLGELQLPRSLSRMYPT